MAKKTIKTITFVNDNGIFKIECFSFHKVISRFNNCWEVDKVFNVHGEILSVE